MEQKTLEYISELLNLEKILVTEEKSILCFPKDKDENFYKMFYDIQNNLPPNTTLKIVDETEIVLNEIEKGETKDDNSELSGESSNNGIE